MKKTMHEVLEFVEDSLGRKLTPKNKIAIAKLFAELVADGGDSAPPPTSPPPPPKP